MKTVYYIIMIIFVLTIVLGAGAFGYYYVFTELKGEKDSVTERRKSVCGDGICQDIVCHGLDCPIPETPERCPQDCI